MNKLRTLGLAAGLIATTGCSSILAGPTPSVRADFDPRLDFPVAALADTDSSSASMSADGDSDARIDRISPPLFWTGIILGVVGTAVAAGFAIDGVVTESKIEDGYEGSFTEQERDDLQERGERDNSLTRVGAGLGVVGFSTAIITAGIDYSRCGPLAKRRKCAPSD